MARRPNPILIVVAAAALTVAITFSIQVVAQSGSSKQQNQKALPPISGGGQFTGGTGIAQGESVMNPASNLADICSQVPKAQVDFIRLREEVALDEEVIRNFGFQQTSEDIQRWGELGEDARRRYEATANDIRMGLVTDSIVAGFKGLAIGLAPLRAQELSGKLISLLEKGGVPEGDELYTIAKKVGVNASVEETEKLVRAIEHVHHVYEVQNKVVGAAENVVGAAEADRLEILKSAVELDSIFIPQAALLAKDLNTLSLAVYATEYKVAQQKIEKLTTLTEDQLKDLRTRTERLKKDVNALSAAKKILEAAKLQNCDSTNLVRKPEESTTSPRATPRAKPKGGGHTGLVVGAVAGAAGIAAAAGLAGQQKSQSATGVCTSSRLCIVSIFAGNPCQCGGTVNGPCGFTGLVAGLGEACPNGVPCQRGLSCNNGRCEGPTGRCPF